MQIFIACTKNVIFSFSIHRLPSSHRIDRLLKVNILYSFAVILKHSFRIKTRDHKNVRTFRNFRIFQIVFCWSVETMKSTFERTVETFVHVWWYTRHHAKVEMPYIWHVIGSKTRAQNRMWKINLMLDSEFFCWATHVSEMFCILNENNLSCCHRWHITTYIDINLPWTSNSTHPIQSTYLLVLLTSLNKNSTSIIVWIYLQSIETQKSILLEHH